MSPSGLRKNVPARRPSSSTTSTSVPPAGPVSGSLRSASGNSTLVRALAAVAPGGVTIESFDALGELPHFNPDLDGDGATPPPAVARWREAIRAADGLVISCPEYAHGVPGAFKNALDWLVGSGELMAKPIALLNASPAKLRRCAR